LEKVEKSSYWQANPVTVFSLNFFENSSIEASWAGVGVNNQGFHDRSPLI